LTLHKCQKTRILKSNETFSMTFKKLFKESFVVMAWVLLFIWGLSNININSDILNPISKAFEDFELTDVVFSQLRENPTVSSDITMVNIGNLNREELAEMINIINEYKPKVIGIDAFFRKPKHSEDPYMDSLLVAGDSALSRAFAKTENLVLVSENFENVSTNKIDSVGYSHSMFVRYSKPGFADMITKGTDHFKSARHCIPKDTLNGKLILSFPSMIAYIYAPQKVKRYLSRNNDTEIINFQGNIDARKEGVSANSKIFLTALDVNQVFDRQFDPSVIKDKIIIMGFMGESLEDNTWEDKFCTPLNENYIGRTLPDMYGVVVHANIVAMILKEDYINDMPFLWNLGIGLVFIFLNVWLFSWLHLNTAEWWDGISMIIALIGVLLLSMVTLAIFNLYNYKFDITLMSVALLLSANLIELYWGIIKPLYNRTKEKNVSLQSNNKTSDSI